MPSRTLQLDAIVLSRHPAKDPYQAFLLLSGSLGVLQVLQRMPRSPGSGRRISASLAPPLDLFDEAGLVLESSNQGRTWFVKEARILKRAEGIARDYTRLELACRFGALVARNPADEESRPRITSLVQTAIAAFASPADPGMVYFKSLYRFARDEGHPVKEQWLAGLPSTLRSGAETLLGTPVSGYRPGPDSGKTISQLTRRLEDYLRGHTELLLD